MAAGAAWCALSLLPLATPDPARYLDVLFVVPYSLTLAGMVDLHTVQCHQTGRPGRFGFWVSAAADSLGAAGRRGRLGRRIPPPGYRGGARPRRASLGWRGAGAFSATCHGGGARPLADQPPFKHRRLLRCDWPRARLVSAQSGTASPPPAEKQRSTIWPSRHRERLLWRLRR